MTPQEIWENLLDEGSLKLYGEINDLTVLAKQLSQLKFKQIAKFTDLYGAGTLRFIYTTDPETDATSMHISIDYPTKYQDARVGILP